MAALKWKPKGQQVRIIYSDGPGSADVVTKNPNKVFAVIGPFDSHTDKPLLQDALELVLRGYNLEPNERE